MLLGLNHFFSCELGSYRKKLSKPWLIVRRRGNNPIQVVAGERYRTKKRAEKEARSWNKAYEGSDVQFMRRREG
jgi:hypothetical protein